MPPGLGLSSPQPIPIVRPWACAVRLPTALSKWNFTTKLQWKVCSKCPQVLPPQGQGAKGTVKGARYTCTHSYGNTVFSFESAHFGTVQGAGRCDIHSEQAKET